MFQFLFTDSKRSDGRRRKKIPPNIISFDDEESDTTHSQSDISLNTPPSPNPLPTINQSNPVDVSLILVTNLIFIDPVNFLLSHVNKIYWLHV